MNVHQTRRLPLHPGLEPAPTGETSEDVQAFDVRVKFVFYLLDLVRYRDIAIVSPRGFWSLESRRPSGG